MGDLLSLVEMLHHELFASRGPSRKVLERLGEVLVRIQGDREAKIPLPVLDHLPDSPFAGVCQREALGAEGPNGTLDLAREALSVSPRV